MYLTIHFIQLRKNQFYHFVIGDEFVNVTQEHFVRICYLCFKGQYSLIPYLPDYH